MKDLLEEYGTQQRSGCFVEAALKHARSRLVWKTRNEDWMKSKQGLPDKKPLDFQVKFKRTDIMDGNDSCDFDTPETE